MAWTNPGPNRQLPRQQHVGRESTPFALPLAMLAIPESVIDCGLLLQASKRNCLCNKLFVAEFEVEYEPTHLASHSYYYHTAESVPWREMRNTASVNIKNCPTNNKRLSAYISCCFHKVCMSSRCNIKTTITHLSKQPAMPDTKHFLFEENHRPWFVWALLLAPCFMPFFW